MQTSFSVFMVLSLVLFVWQGAAAPQPCYVDATWKCTDSQRCCNSYCREVGGTQAKPCNPLCACHETCCDGVCKPIDSNCGACGKQCAPGQTCCLSSETAGATCVDLQTNTQFCGSCRAFITDGWAGQPIVQKSDCAACPAGQICWGGRCMAPDCSNSVRCATGLDCCNSECVNLKTDPKNCGVCNATCPVGEVCCSGACKALGTSSNCRWCGDACPAGQSCTVDGCKPVNNPTPTPAPTPTTTPTSTTFEPPTYTTNQPTSTYYPPTTSTPPTPTPTSTTFTPPMYSTEQPTTTYYPPSTSTAPTPTPLSTPQQPHTTYYTYD